MWPLFLLLLLALVFVISITWTKSLGAPWIPTPMKKVHRMLAMAEVGTEDLVYDLGCGDGRTIVAAARRFGCRAVGIEIDPLRYLWCQILITLLGLRSRIQVIYGDFFTQDLSDANVVTCYLLPNTNEILERKFMQELHPSTRVISSDFIFPGLRLLQEDIKANLYLYHPVPKHDLTGEHMI